MINTIVKLIIKDFDSLFFEILKIYQTARVNIQNLKKKKVLLIEI